MRTAPTGTVLTVLAAVIGGWAAAPRLAAQEKPGAGSAPFIAREGVSVTNLDVVVTDGKGNRVTGLKKEDFFIVEDGVELPVSNFTAIEQGRFLLPPEETAAPAAPAPAPAPAPAAAPLPGPKTRIVIFIDNLHITPFDRNRVLRNVETFVRDAIKGDVEGMIVTFNRTLKVRRKFTNDGRDLSDILKQIEEESALGTQIDSERRDVIKAIDDSTTADQAVGRVRGYVQSLENDLKFTFDAMKTTINQLSGVEGRKIMVHVSGGLPQSPGLELWSYVQARYPNSTSYSMGQFEFDKTTSYLGIIQAANAAGVSMYAIDAGGLTVDSNVTAENRTTSQRIDTFLEKNNLQNMLILMAEETGGRAIINRNDVGLALKDMEKDYTSYYSLGYRSVRSGLDRPHKVDVKLKAKKGLTVLARRSYVEKGFDTKVREGVTSALFFSRDENPLGAALDGGRPRPRPRELPGPDPDPRAVLAHRAAARRDEGPRPARLLLRRGRLRGQAVGAHLPARAGGSRREDPRRPEQARLSVRREARHDPGRPEAVARDSRRRHEHDELPAEGDLRLGVRGGAPGEAVRP